MLKILNNFSVFSTLLPVIAAIFYYRRFNKTFKILAVFFILSALFDLALIVVLKLGLQNNAPLLHLFVVISILFLSIVYYRTLGNGLLKKLIVVLVVLALLFVIFNSLFIEGIWAFPSISNTVQSVLFITFSLFYFYQLLSNQEVIHIEKQGLFWINAGVLVYFSSNIFLFMLFNRIIEAQEWNLWIIHSITNIIANVLYTIGLLCKPQIPTSYQYS